MRLGGLGLVGAGCVKGGKFGVREGLRACFYLRNQEMGGSQRGD